MTGKPPTVSLYHYFVHLLTHTGLNQGSQTQKGQMGGDQGPGAGPRPDVWDHWFTNLHTRSELYLCVSLRAETWAGCRAYHAQTRLWSSGRVLVRVGQTHWAQSHRAARLPQRCPPGAWSLSNCRFAWFLLDRRWKFNICCLLLSHRYGKHCCCILFLCFLFFFRYLFHLAGSSTCWHRGRKQASGVAFVVQIVYDFSVFGFFCKHLGISEVKKKKESHRTGLTLTDSVFQSAAAPLTWLSITLRLALLLWAGAAGRLGLALGLVLSRLAFLLLILGWTDLQGGGRVFLPLVKADLLLAAHTRDRTPAWRWRWKSRWHAGSWSVRGNHSMCSQLTAACANQHTSEVWWSQQHMLCQLLTPGNDKKQNTSSPMFLSMNRSSVNQTNRGHYTCNPQVLLTTQNDWMSDILTPMSVSVSDT